MPRKLTHPGVPLDDGLGLASGVGVDRPAGRVPLADGDAAVPEDEAGLPLPSGPPLPLPCPARPVLALVG